MKIIVLADDMTGAAEVAGAAVRWGLSAEVHIGQLHASSADVVVVDADSRSLSPAAAYAQIFELTRQAVQANADLLFKKVDSLLRGAVLAEVTAMRTAAAHEQSLLICANPRKGRTVVAGQLNIDGRPVQNTPLASDPEHPRLTSDVRELLRLGSSATEASVASADAPLVYWDSVDVIAAGQPSAARLMVGNAASDDELEAQLAYWLSRAQPAPLLAGGAECFEALLKKVVVGGAQAPAKDQPLLADGDTLLISGSRASQVDDWPRVICDRRQSTAEWTYDVCETLARYGRAALRAVDLQDGTPTARVEYIVDVASRVLATCRPAQVWIEGGHAASTLMRTLGCRRLLALFNAGDGIVAMRVVDEHSPIYLLKPGSYPWTCRQASSMQPVATTTTDLES